jgi:hypothetical protein
MKYRIVTATGNNEVTKYTVDADEPAPSMLECESGNLVPWHHVRLLVPLTSDNEHRCEAKAHAACVVGLNRCTKSRDHESRHTTEEGYMW